MVTIVHRKKETISLAPGWSGASENLPPWTVVTEFRATWTVVAANAPPWRVGKLGQSEFSDSSRGRVRSNDCSRRAEFGNDCSRGQVFASATPARSQRYYVQCPKTGNVLPFSPKWFLLASCLFFLGGLKLSNAHRPLPPKKGGSKKLTKEKLLASMRYT